MDDYKIEIGKWVITSEFLDCTNVFGRSFEITKVGLFASGGISRENMYDFLLLLVEKEQAKDEIHSLNTAFIIAAKLWEIDLDTEMLKDTLIEQKALWDSLYA